MIKTKYFLVIFYLLWLLTLKVYAEDKVVFTDPLKAILVKKSEPIFTITLQSNPTTGYSWALKGYDPKIIVPLKRKFYPATNHKLLGAPGYEKWVFKIKPEGFTVPQLTSITLIYFRPWDDQGIQAINFRVVTKDAD